MSDQDLYMSFADSNSDSESLQLEDSETESLQDEDEYESAPQIEVNPTDIVIAVMGVTGAGKSTFISLFADEGFEPAIGDTIESQTREITFIPVTLPNQTKLFLVDTPGFNDTYLSDTQILELISENLAAAYKGNIKLRGVIYLHPISDIRMTGASMKNLYMFKALCGEDQLRSVVLATTHWATTESEIAKQNDREKQLRETPKMWGNMIAKGSTILRHNRGKESAAEIIQHLVDKKQPVTLEIQSDIVDKGLQLKDTAAGKEIISDLEKKQKEHDEELAKIRQEMEAAFAKKDKETQEELKAWKAEVQEKMAQAEADRKRLDADKESLWRRLEQARMVTIEAQKQALLQRSHQMRQASRANMNPQSNKQRRPSSNAGSAPPATGPPRGPRAKPPSKPHSNPGAAKAAPKPRTPGGPHAQGPKKNTTPSAPNKKPGHGPAKKTPPGPPGSKAPNKKQPGCPPPPSKKAPSKSGSQKPNTPRRGQQPKRNCNPAPRRRPPVNTRNQPSCLIM